MPVSSLTRRRLRPPTRMAAATRVMVGLRDRSAIASDRHPAVRSARSWQVVLTVSRETHHADSSVRRVSGCAKKERIFFGVRCKHRSRPGRVENVCLDEAMAGRNS